jgi:hypothetical protein
MRKALVLLAPTALLLLIVGLLLNRIDDGPSSRRSHSLRSESFESDPTSFETARPRSADDVVETTFEIRGIVEDSRATGLPGAQVCSMELSGSTPRPSSLTCAISDGEGTFLLHRRKPGVYAVSARARGYVAEAAPAVIEVGESRNHNPDTELVLRMTTGGRVVRGVIEDAAGGVIEGALVRVVELDRLGASWSISDTDGEFELSFGHRQGRLLVASAAGYGEGVRVLPAGEEIWVTMTLKPEGILGGRVVDAASGRIIAGARVYPHALEGAVIQGKADLPFAMSDENGRFEFSGLSSGRYRPEARGGGWWGRSSDDVQLTSGSAAEVVIEVGPAYSIRGRVEDSDRRPCPHGWVYLYDGILAFAVAKIGPDGAVGFDGIPPGAYDSMVECGGFRTEENFSIEIDEYDLDGLRWEVEPLGRWTVAGTALVSGRESAQNVIVTLQRTDVVQGDPLVLQSRSEPSGSFSFSGLPNGVYELAAHSASGAQSETTSVTVSDGDAIGVELAFPPVGALSIEVRDTDGAPVVGQDLVVRSATEGSLVSTNTEGLALLASVAVGHHSIALLPQGVGGRAVSAGVEALQEAEVEVRADTMKHLTMTIPPRTGVIEGRVVADDGTPIGEAHVEIFSDVRFLAWSGAQSRARIARVSTDGDGTFVVENLDPDRNYSVAVTAPGFDSSIEAPAELGRRTRVVLPLP